MSATSAGAIFARMTADGDLMLAQLDRWAAETPDKVFLHYGEDGVRLADAAVGPLAVAEGDVLNRRAEERATTRVRQAEEHAPRLAAGRPPSWE